ncbi:type I polyketide synthase [soil metagenome]
MACRLPGGIDSPQQLWDALLQGNDLVTEVPSDRWDADDYYDPEPGVPGRSISKWGAFLDDVAGFDPEFFGINEREATAMDPQHRLLMETAWEAVEHAGLIPSSLAGSATGVFFGLSHDDYSAVTSGAGVYDQAYAFTGTPFSMASGRVSYSMGLRGPAMTLDTACSSSMYAIHHACRSLHEGESDMVLAGGVMVMLDPKLYASSSGQGMLSPTGRCHSFDVGADGFVRSEGCGVVLLKRLADAERDGDRILAVVRGTASNQDGRTDNILTPSKDAQIDVFRAALDVSGVEAGTVAMVEGHGTGTPVGDAIEYGSISTVYAADGPVALTSVKSNFGHAESAAGVLGLMKTVLSVEHGVIPQNLHFNRLSDAMAEVKTGLFVPTENTPWPAEYTGPRRAGVSSYGMSGTNVHAIVEQAPQPTPVSDASSRTATGGLLVFPVTSSSADELRTTAQRLADWVEASDAGLALPDLAYTLARRRGHRSVRTAVIAQNPTDLVERLIEVADGDEPFQPVVGRDDRGPVWVFSGQGSQWAEMGAGLLATEPVFAATIAEIEPLIEAESGFSVTAALTAPETVTGIDRVQPTIFAMQVAMAATMKTYGVQPGAVIGHSLGEVGAAVVAGALSLEDGVKVICRRSRLCLELAGGGAMASVELPAQKVREELEQQGIEDVVVAVVASPVSTVIGGSTQTVRDIVAAWEQREVMAREVAVDVASHSPQVDPILDRLAEELADLSPLAPEVKYYSATSYDPREEPYCDADYWVDNLRHTVRFSAAVQSALEDGFRVFGELSPHPLLIRAVDQTSTAADIATAALPAMRRGEEVPHGLRGFLGNLFAAGAEVDFSALFPGGRLVDAPLPSWTHRHLLLGAEGVDHQARGAHLVAAHPLLGSHVKLLEEPERHVWAAEVGTAALPWLVDHQVNNVAALPGAAYCEMALAAARTAFGEAAEVRDVTFETMLLLKEETPVSATASVDASGAFEFVVETNQDGERERRASAVLHAAEPDDANHAYNLVDLLASHPLRMAGEDVRKWFDGRGVQFGPAFTGLTAVNAGEGAAAATVLAEIGLPTSIRSQQGVFDVHPALLDACFQSVAAHPGVQTTGTGGLLLPLGVRRLRVHGPTKNARYCLTTVTSLDGSGVEADIVLLDEFGTALLTVDGLSMGSGMSDGNDGARVLNERLLAIEWRQQELHDNVSVNPGTFLIVSTSDGADLLTSQLSDALKLRDAEVSTLSWPEHADHAALAERLSASLTTTAFDGVVVVATPLNSSPEEQLARRGGEHIRHLVRIVRELPEAPGRPPRLYVVTRSAQAVLADDRPNLEQAGVRGLLRVIGAEHPSLRPTQIDVDTTSDAKLVALQLLTGSEEDETAFRDGQWYTAHLYPGPLRPDERHTTVVDNQRDGMRLEIRTPGDMQTLELAAFDRIPPGPGQIEVAVAASSLNFADVLVAFGRYPSFDGGRPQLGLDFAGQVTAVGPDVTSHKVGDHVGGMSANGCWGTFLTCNADVAVTLPRGLRADQAAAITTASATAWYSLHDLARIKAGDKVLIHSATGGVGKAAVAIAQAAGAEIYATAGTEERRELLRDMGIAHSYDSRSAAFADEIRVDTDGYGVDIVLNSLTGASQRAGVELLAFGGRFVEIGKKDIYDDTRMGLFPFRRNLSFYGVDLALMCSTHPEQIRDLLDTVYRLTAEGVLPQPETTHYPLAEAATAIRVMGAAEHTGKLLLSMPRVGHTSVVVPEDQAHVFRGDGAYIVSGGLGGLGLFLASKMAAAGCGRIVLNSRRLPKPEATAEIERMRAGGTDVEVVTGDIAESETVDALVAAATATGLPVRGVLHAAAVVEDAILTNITDKLVERDWDPKVYGAWHLHRATIAEPLDWFCSFSSAAALLGSPGQGAYAAANSWLDGFTHWRRAQGLPATAIAWAAWDKIGRGAHLAADGETTMIRPEEGAYAFEAMLRHDRAYSGYAPAIGTPWLTDLAERSSFAEAFRSNTSGTVGVSGFRAELHELPRDEWAARVRKLVSEQVSLILRRSVDPDRPVSEYGLDSLGNLELRTRIETVTGIRVRSIDITTVRALSESLCEMLTGVVTSAESR